jgi:hypothetical protein
MTTHLVDGCLQETVLLILISIWENVFSMHAFPSRADTLDQLQQLSTPRNAWLPKIVNGSKRLRLRGGVSTRSEPFVPYSLLENEQKGKNSASPAYGTNSRKRIAAASVFGTDARKRTAKRLLLSTDDDGIDTPGSNEESAHISKVRNKRDPDEDLIVPDQCESLKEALRLVVPGQTIYVRAGEHRWRAELATPANASTDIRGELGARLWGQWARRALQVRTSMGDANAVDPPAMPRSSEPIQNCCAA